jgi:AraC-like DNA-binding protein
MAMLRETRLTPSEPSIYLIPISALIQKRSRVSPDKLLKLIFVSRVAFHEPFSHLPAIDDESSFHECLGSVTEYPPSLAEAGNLRASKRTLENLTPWRVKRAKELMLTLMTQGCSIEHLASECASSRSHFSRGFKNATGLAPHDWLRQEKMHRAEELLRTGRVPIGRVAQECGFSDQSYFTRVFKRQKGVSPRQWQALNCPKAPD